MRVKLLRSVATALKVYSAGAVADVPDELAVRWCQEGVAEPEDPGELHELLQKQAAEGAEDETPEGDDEPGDDTPQGEDAEAEAKAQAGPPETKAKEAPPEDKEAGVTDDGGSGDAGGSKGGAGSRSAGRRTAPKAD